MTKHQACSQCLSDFVGPDSNIGENLCPTCEDGVHGECHAEFALLACEHRALHTKVERLETEEEILVTHFRTLDAREGRTGDGKGHTPAQTAVRVMVERAAEVERLQASHDEAIDTTAALWNRCKNQETTIRTLKSDLEGLRETNKMLLRAKDQAVVNLTDSRADLSTLCEAVAAVVELRESVNWWGIPTDVEANDIDKAVEHLREAAKIKAPPADEVDGDRADEAYEMSDCELDDAYERHLAGLEDKRAEAKPADETHDPDPDGDRLPENDR